jgi:hypothetical protein
MAAAGALLPASALTRPAAAAPMSLPTARVRAPPVAARPGPPGRAALAASLGSAAPARRRAAQAHRGCEPGAPSLILYAGCLPRAAQCEARSHQFIVQCTGSSEDGLNQRFPLHKISRRSAIKTV